MKAEKLSATPPEVILDRFIRTELVKIPQFRDYIGKLDVDQLEPSLAALLHALHANVNEALRLEGINASGGDVHPPFHFDFVEVKGHVANAHAFEHEGYAFVVMTLPMMLRLLELSKQLATSRPILELLDLDHSSVDIEVAQGFFCQIQLNFLVAHEYTHHIHKHVGARQWGVLALWTEFSENQSESNLRVQAQELNADGYAAFLVLAHLLRGERRQIALTLWGSEDGFLTDKRLLIAFYFSAMTFFCEFLSQGMTLSSFLQSTHPPVAIRIKNAVIMMGMWADQNSHIPRPWFTPEVFRPFFIAGIETTKVSREIWEAQISCLQSTEGQSYDKLLFEEFEKIRKGPTPS